MTVFPKSHCVNFLNILFIRQPLYFHLCKHLCVYLTLSLKRVFVFLVKLHGVYFIFYLACKVVDLYLMKSIAAVVINLSLEDKLND